MPTDELAEIDGLKPNIVLKDGEEKEVKSKSSSSVYKVKRTFDHYYCSCPAWRNQSGAPVNARACKHTKELLGEKYELARVKMKNPDGVKAPSKAKAAPKTKSKRKAVDEDEEDVKPTRRAPTRKRKADEDEDEDEEEKPQPKKTRTVPTRRAKAPKEEEEEEDKDEEVPVRATRKPPSRKPASRAAKPASKVTKPASKAAKPASKVTKPASKVAKPEPPIDEDVDMGEADEDNTTPASGGDELAEIGGLKPKVYMKDGDEREVQSQSSSSTYKVKRTWDHYYCTCPAWRNQGGAPVNARTCKHLKELLGEKYELARIKLKNPNGPVPASKSKPQSRKKGKADDDDDTTVPSSKKAPELLLANKWDLEKGPDPTGWKMSEKLDGVRTYYDGKAMYSRLGNPFTPPQWFLDKLPKDVTLDGELFGGRGKFQDTVSIVKTVNSPHWQNITFQLFDIPSKGDDPFEERIAHLEKMFGAGGDWHSDKVHVLEHVVVRDRQHVLDELKRVEGLGGEGLMLRKPGSKYEGHRSASLLKIKTFYDAEAVVTGHTPGKGRHAGVVGALSCTMESGKTFAVGSGLSDALRRKPPKVGAIITYRFQELTRDGVPRFPTYIGEAIDKDSPKDAEIPEHRKAGAAGAEDD